MAELAFTLWVARQAIDQHIGKRQHMQFGHGVQASHGMRQGRSGYSGARRWVSSGC